MCGASNRDSLRDRAVNHLLEKLSTSGRLTAREKATLERLTGIDDEVFTDHRMITALDVVTRVSRLLSHGITVVCNLEDSMGRVGQDVARAVDTDGKKVLHLVDGTKFSLEDRFLYDLVFSLPHLRFHLESGHEFYEPAKIK